MRIRFFLLALLPLLLPAYANADWDYVAYANGQLMSDVFDGIKSIILTNSEYMTAVVIIAIFCFAIVVVKAAIDSKFVDIMIYTVVVWMGQYLLFQKGIDIVITDPFDAAAVYNVTDVPFIIGFPIVAVNAVGTEFTELYETNFVNLDSELTVGAGNAPGSMARILRDIGRVQIGNTIVKANTTAYFQDCVLPMIFDGQITVEQLRNSADVLTLIRSTHVARFTTQSGAGGQTTVTCAAAYTAIQNTFNAASAGASDNWFGIISPSQAVGNDALKSAFSAGAASNVLLDAAIQQGTGNATTGSTFLSNVLLSGGLDEGVKAASIASGSNEVLAALNIDQARKVQQVSWYTSGELFQDMAGYFYSLMNVLIVALTPILMLALFIPKVGAKVLGMYFKVLVWLALWWPGLAVVNYMSAYFLTNQIVGAQATCVGCASGSINNADIVSSFGSNASSAAGFMATIVPMLMWGIVSGSAHALVGALQQASGKAQAGAAATNIATNSYSADTVSYNNTSANKFDNTDSFETGTKPTVINDANASVNLRDNVGDQSVIKGDTSVKNQISESLSTSQKEVAAARAENDRALQEGLTTEVSKAAATLNQYGSMVNGQWQWSSQEAYEKNKTEIDQAVQTLKDTQAVAQDTTNAASEEAQAGLNLGLSGGFKGGGEGAGFLGITGGADIRGAIKSIETEQERATTAMAEENANSSASATGEKASESQKREQAITTGESGGTTDSIQSGTKMSETASLIATHKRTEQALDSVEKDIKQTIDQGFNRDLTVAEYQEMAGRINTNMDAAKERLEKMQQKVEDNGDSMSGQATDKLMADSRELVAKERGVNNDVAALKSEATQVSARTADRLAGNASELNTDQKLESLLSQDSNNETRLARMGNQNLDKMELDLGNGITAKALGAANIEGQDKPQIVYEFMKDGQVIGAGALVSNGKGGADIVLPERSTYADLTNNANAMQAGAATPGIIDMGRNKAADVASVASETLADKIRSDNQLNQDGVLNSPSQVGAFQGTLSSGNLNINNQNYKIAGDWSTAQAIPGSNSGNGYGMNNPMANRTSLKPVDGSGQ